MAAEVLPWSLNPDGYAQVREDLPMMHMGLETAVLAACAADPKLASAADSLLTALAPTLAEVRRRSTTPILHLDQLAVRAQRKGSATERATARAEAPIRAALAGLQVEALTAEPMPTSQIRWRPGPERNVGFKATTPTARSMSANLLTSSAAWGRTSSTSATRSAG